MISEEAQVTAELKLAAIAPLDNILFLKDAVTGSCGLTNAHRSYDLR